MGTEEVVCFAAGGAVGGGGGGGASIGASSPPPQANSTTAIKLAKSSKFSFFPNRDMFIMVNPYNIISFKLLIEIKFIYNTRSNECIYKILYIYNNLLPSYKYLSI